MVRGELEKDILEKATGIFKEKTGLERVGITYGNKGQIEREQDLIVKIKAGEQIEHDIEYYVAIKKRITRPLIGTLAYTFNQPGKERLLVTDYVNPVIAQELRKREIQFMDTCGNAYINHFPLFVYIQGNKTDTNWKIGTHGQRAFTKTGLQVVFALLCNPELANEPIRNIADIAGVAIGTVDAVFNNLKEYKFLIDKGKRGRNLLNRKNLLERWVTGFQETLRKGILIAKYTAGDKNWWKGVKLPQDVYWGGEVAAARLTAYLQPEMITIYTHADYKELLLKYKLKKDPQGEIEVLKAFWNKEVFSPRKDLVHPLLVYADLLAHGDARNIETAKRIYEGEIENCLF